MPRVSVIIAARDAAATLPETLDSVRAQTFSDWEIVLADDASSDATAELARAAGARVVATGGPLGPGRARNVAAEHAEGELIATLDADDAWEPDYLAAQVAAYDRAASAGMRVGLVTCDALLRAPGGIERETWSERVGCAQDLTLTRLLDANVVFTSVLLPRAVFAEQGGYDPGLRQAEDYDLWLRIVAAGYATVHTPRPLAIYRLRPDSLTAASPEAAASTAQVYERALARGGLTASQRRLARRRRRLYRLVAERARIAAAAAAGERVLARKLRAAPLTALVGLEHPERWLGWLRRGPRAAGPARHA